MHLGPSQPVMQPYWWYWMWTTGTFTVTHTIPLDWRRTYLVTGALTQTDGDDYAHVYISMVCSYSGGDVVRCGVRDIPDDVDLNLTEFISGARSVTVKLRTTGGRHRAEGIVYEL
jgi:hypothetical protein